MVLFDVKLLKEGEGVNSTEKFVGYRCSLCNREYAPGEVTYTCPEDGGNLDVILDYDSIRQKFQADDLISRPEESLWRYLPLLPVPCPANKIGLRRANL